MAQQMKTEEEKKLFDCLGRLWTELEINADGDYGFAKDIEFVADYAEQAYCRIKKLQSAVVIMGSLLFVAAIYIFFLK